MSKLPIPFNIEIMQLTKQKLDYLGQVTSLDVFDASTRQYHPQGLFSSEIFGMEGSDRRMKTYGYIDLKVEVFHPIIFKTITRLKLFYKDILSGKKYAIFDKKLGEFIEVDPLEENADTGFHFFVSHWKELKFTQNKSSKRDENIKLVEKYRDRALTSKLVVMPAGMRDVEVSESTGRPSYDEVNEYYFSMLRFTNTISDAGLRNNPEILDHVRHRIQITFNELYEYLSSLIEGKKKLYMGKFVSRGVHFGTRNVITTMIPKVKRLDNEDGLNTNNTVVGMYQTLKGTSPIAKYHIRNKYLNNIFIDNNMPARLVDPKTLELREVKLDNDEYDYWTSKEGLEKVLNSFKAVDTRHDPIMIKGHYLALIYKGKGTFRVFHDIRDLPEGASKKDVSPITLTEFLYCSTYEAMKEIPAFVTRYPITGVGSIYPSMTYMRTTMDTEERQELDESWEIDESKPKAIEFPIRGSVFFDTVSPSFDKLGRLGGDFDGDTVSCNFTFTDESKEEIKDFLQSRRAYVDPAGNLINSFSINSNEIFLSNFTG